MSEYLGILLLLSTFFIVENHRTMINQHKTITLIMKINY